MKEVGAFEAKSRLGQLLDRVEAGEEVVIARGRVPAVKLAPLDEKLEAAAVIERILTLRDSGAVKPVTVDEILAWRHEGHRY